MRHTVRPRYASFLGYMSNIWENKMCANIWQTTFMDCYLVINMLSTLTLDNDICPLHLTRVTFLTWPLQRKISTISNFWLCVELNNSAELSTNQQPDIIALTSPKWCILFNSLKPWTSCFTIFCKYTPFLFYN